MIVVLKRLKNKTFCEDCDHLCNPNKEDYDYDHNPIKKETWYFCVIFFVRLRSWSQSLSVVVFVKTQKYDIF